MTKRNKKGFKKELKKGRNCIKIIIQIKFSAHNHARTIIQKTVIKIPTVLKN